MEGMAISKKGFALPADTGVASTGAAAAGRGADVATAAAASATAFPLCTSVLSRSSCSMACKT